MTRCVLSARLSAILCTTALLLAVTGASQPARAQGPTLQGVASVIDGDTLEIHGTRIRLHGIDTPESGQRCEDANGALYRCGQWAALALANRIGRRTVICEQTDIDHRHDRIVAVCMLDDVDLNEWLVRDGAALAYRRYSLDYVSAEDVARRDRRGIWAGRFIAPWDWRRGERLSSEQNTSEGNAAQKPGCEIKGNVSRSGARIYHLPGQAHYARTRISPDKGERWFCSEAEARAAGWRRAQR